MANNNPEKYWPKTTQNNLATDEHGYLVVELKCMDRLANEHTAQCLNYPRLSNLGLCLLVDFQKAKVEWRRIIQGFYVPGQVETPTVAE